MERAEDIGNRESSHSTNINGLDTSMSRNQLILAWGWAVGLRVSEIVGSKGLGLKQFSDINPNPVFSMKEIGILVTGKGGKCRKVGVPAWLVISTKNYIHENKLTQPSSVAKPVFDISPRRAEQILTELCERCGLLEEKTDKDEIFPVKSIAKYRFHDLRHSYAVQRYTVEVQLGNSEPWKAIQVQLGHIDLQTTIRSYLRWVGGTTPYSLACASGLLGLSTPSLGE